MICKNCGQVVADNARVCDSCGTSIATVEKYEYASVPQEEKRENMVAGMIGAFLGSLLGGASIILLSQVGYVASISGLILAVCTIKGYQLLGGKFSTNGIVICSVIMLVMPYFADRVDWAIYLLRDIPEAQLTFFEAYRIIPELLSEGFIEMGVYVKNLLMIYGFTALGAFSSLKKAFKK